jgi:hypothetical protein
MSVPITISGTTVNFPSSGDSPNWSPAVIQFAQLVAAALEFTVGAFDIPPQTFDITADVNTNVALPNLSFPTTQVNGAIIAFSVIRVSSTTTVTETGNMVINYNPTFPTNQKWEISVDYVGNADITFSVTDVGQVQFSTTSLPGSFVSASITYQAKAILT